jgi:hypothetical protein
MDTDQHGNHLLDETETRVLMELQEWRVGDTVAEWFFHDEYRFKLVREDESENRPGRERQRRYQRKFRLYEHRPDLIRPVHDAYGFKSYQIGWYPSVGGQWHDSIRSGYLRAEYVADCYHSSKLDKQKNERAKERRRIAEELRPRHITEKKPRISR